MSLRTQSIAPAIEPRNRLQQVLLAGLHVKASTDPEPSTGPTGVDRTCTVQDLILSTDWNNWTGLNLSSVMKLQLKPERGANNITTFEGERMLSPFAPDRVFFVHSVAGVARGGERVMEVAYYVLARPRSDDHIYIRNERPFKLNSSGARVYR